jgi:hypothetical protein
MVINFSVVPTNVTGTKIITEHAGTDIETTTEVKFDYFSPLSWFEVTVRNKQTGKILLQDGFNKGYMTSTNRTIKVLNRDNVQIELLGNQITATVDVGVKKDGNIK